MNNLEILATFGNTEDVQNYLVHQLIQKELTEKRYSYTCVKFNMNSIPPENFRFLFRFEKEHIIKLHQALQMPAKWVTPDGHVIEGLLLSTIEKKFRIFKHSSFIGLAGLCLVLRRFSYPNRLKGLQNEFGLHFSSISKILKFVVTFIFKKWAKLLLNFDKNIWLTQGFLAEVAAFVHKKGAPLRNCIGFIDGTARAICRPSKFQKEVYSGHKRIHCLKFQSITVPNGIILHLSPPYSGRRHDSFILKNSKILEQMKLHCPQFCLYGDEGYPLVQQLIRPFSNHNLTEQQQMFNTKMSKIRQCVEWSFGKITTQFAFVDLKKNQKLFLQPIGQYYIVAALLTNAHTCFYGSTTSRYFDIESLDIMEYFQ